MNLGNLSRLGLVTLALGVATACARKPNDSAPLAALTDSTSLTIDNQGYVDMTIYVLEGGASRRRLGIASAAQRTTLPIPRTLIGNGRDLQFLADPIAGRGNVVSRRIYVAPGDRIGLTLLP